MKYLKWVYKSAKWLLCGLATAIMIAAGWLSEKLDDEQVTRESLTREFKELWDGSAKRK